MGAEGWDFIDQSWAFVEGTACSDGWKRWPLTLPEDNAGGSCLVDDKVAGCDTPRNVWLA